MLSSADFVRLANRWIECGKLNEEQGKKVREYIMGFWSAISNGKKLSQKKNFSSNIIPSSEVRSIAYVTVAVFNLIIQF